MFFQKQGNCLIIFCSDYGIVSYLAQREEGRLNNEIRRVNNEINDLTEKRNIQEVRNLFWCITCSCYWPNIHNKFKQLESSRFQEGIHLSWLDVLSSPYILEWLFPTILDEDNYKDEIASILSNACAWISTIWWENVIAIIIQKVEFDRPGERSPE